MKSSRIIGFNHALSKPSNNLNLNLIQACFSIPTASQSQSQSQRSRSRSRSTLGIQSPSSRSSIHSHPIPNNRNSRISRTNTRIRTLTSSCASLNRHQAESPFNLTRKLADSLNLPRFKANASQFQLLQHPNHFYQTLKASIQKAEKRIFISSLYIGKEEVELISHLRSALASKPSLRLLILTDALRSTREPSPSPSCASLISSLVKEFPNQVDARLWHTPKLKHGGWLKKLVGKRFNEGFGLQHMKVYGMDQDVMISGANLSNDYFTNRRDRYLMIRNHRLLSDYLHSLLLLVCRFSYSILPTFNIDPNLDSIESSSEPETTRNPYCGFEMKWDGGRSLLLSESLDGSVSEDGSLSQIQSEPYLEHSWKDRALKEVQDFTLRWRDHSASFYSCPSSGEGKEYDSELVPLIQMGPIGITQETDAVPIIFSQLNKKAFSPSSTSRDNTDEGKPIRMDLTSGYFSLYGPYKSLVLNSHSNPEPEDDTSKDSSSCSEIRIIAAAPESNGFFQSKGVSKYLPPAYTHLENQFWQELKKRNRDKWVEIREWKKDGWTYHAKGIWLTPASSKGPTHTLIGSSNYGSRSARLDLECSLFVSTTSKDFHETLSQEVEGLRRDAVDLVNDELFQRKDRRVGWPVRIATLFVKGML